MSIFWRRWWDSTGLISALRKYRMQSACGVAMAAQFLIQEGQLVKGGELVPVYHRLSQAERERNERLSKEGESTNV